MATKVSHTSESSAAQRAMHTLYAHPPKIFEDPYALELAGPRWKRLLSSRPIAWLLDRWLLRWTKPMMALHVARARYTEDCVDAALESGLAHYVILGAGMDSFSLRRLDLDGTLTVFEVDLPGTQAAKRARLAECGLSEPPHTRYVPVDFETDSLVESLLAAGLDREAPTLFSWLGVQPYLTRDAIANTLGAAAELSAPGSEFICDIMDHRALNEGMTYVPMKRTVEFSTKRGEPFVTGLEPAEFEEILARAGWEVAELLDAEAQEARWFAERKDGLTALKYFYIVRARFAVRAQS